MVVIVCAIVFTVLAVKRRISDAGLRILNNQVVEVGRVQFAGLDYMSADATSFNMHPSEGRATVRSVLPTLPLRHDEPSILIRHGPFGAHYARDAGIGLVLAGHTHGGQIFPLNLLTPLLSPFDRGLHDLGPTKVLVSPGVGTVMVRARLGASNELDLLRLVPAAGWQRGPTGVRGRATLNKNRGRNSMTVQLHAFTCGHLTLPRAMMLKGGEGMITVPVPAYLITHPRGLVLFDTGLHVATQEDAERHVGSMLASLHAFHFEAGEEIGARLRFIGIDPGSIDIVVNSHLHFDHCGGNDALPNADILIQARELAHARAVGDALGYLAGQWDTGQRFRAVDGEHDLFGDGTVVCLPTYGHTPGHQSLRVRTELGGEFILCADACYLRENLERMMLPGVVADPEAALSVFHRLAEMRSRGSTLLFGHDPETWGKVPQAPLRLG